MRSEMLENYVALSITNILAMLLLAFVVGRNNLLDRKMKRFFPLPFFARYLSSLRKSEPLFLDSRLPLSASRICFLMCSAFHFLHLLPFLLHLFLTIKITEIYFTCSFQLLPTCFWLCSRQNSV